MSAPETAIERLNYFNGQRLEAGDFRAEQAYHIGVRRWLNRSLYVPGIACGLMVTKHPTDKHKVMVSPGLAIDSEGREIILLEQTEVLARGVPTGPSGMVFGNYLVVSYYEAKAAGAQDGCCTESSPPPAKAKHGCGCGCASPATCTCGPASKRCDPTRDHELAWGGMTRIRADPILDFQGTWPTRASGKIVLAQLDLNAQCQVVQVLTGMRQYTSGMQPPKVRALALEGEKDIDHDNPKVLFFDIDGANPESVVLKLWATKFTTLYYTEMARHTHLIVGNTQDITHDFAHSHTPSGDTSASGGHNHEYFCDDKNNAPRCFVVTQPDGDSGKPPGLPQILPVGDHVHNLGTLKLTTDLGPWTHHHTLPAAVADTGVFGPAPRDSQSSYGYVDDLRIELDGVDITPLVVAHLNGLNPGKWLKLGDGTPVHTIAGKDGTGSVELKQLGIEFPIGSHKLVFSVPAGKGGQIHYNLYVA